MKNQTPSEHILAELRRRLSRVKELPLRLQQWRQAQGGKPPAVRKPTIVPELDWQPRRRLSVCSEVGPRDSIFTTFVLPPISDPHDR